MFNQKNKKFKTILNKPFDVFTLFNSINKTDMHLKIKKSCKCKTKTISYYINLKK